MPPVPAQRCVHGVEILCRVGRAAPRRAPPVVGFGQAGSGRPRKEIPVKYVLAILAVVLGIAAFGYGGADDSPGLQLLGALLVIGAVVFGVRTARRT